MTALIIALVFVYLVGAWLTYSIASHLTTHSEPLDKVDYTVIALWPVAVPIFAIFSK